MRAPDFWREEAWPARLLGPLGRLYGVAGSLRRRLTRSTRAGLPVVCVGNLVAGGAGKTPTALALAERLRARGARPFFLSRGYGGSFAGPLLVDPAQQSAAQVGDEPLLLAHAGPTLVARDRVAGAAAAVAAGADLLVLDDGFQNPRLVKDFSLLVVDGPQGLGNGRLLPAGPLRESLESGLARADAVVLVGEAEEALRQRLTARPLLAATLVPAANDLAGRAVVAFAGIGRPEKFFATLRQQGARLLAAEGFPDHHAYRPRELARLRDRARAGGARLVTTEKDLVRLPPEQRQGIEALAVRLEFADSEALERLLDRVWPRA